MKDCITCEGSGMDSHSHDACPDCGGTGEENGVMPMSHGINTQKVLELFTELSQNPTYDEYTFGVLDGIKDTLTLLGIKIEGVNA